MTFSTSRLAALVATLQTRVTTHAERDAAGAVLTADRAGLLMVAAAATTMAESSDGPKAAFWGAVEALALYSVARTDDEREALLTMAEECIR